MSPEQRFLFDGPRPVWRWRGEFEIPNASLWRQPFGFYLRTRRFRYTAGFFGWRVKRVS